MDDGSDPTLAHLGTADTGTDGTTPAPRLWWMYVMLIVALAAIGVGAGQIAFVLNNPTGKVRLGDCELDQGINPFTGLTASQLGLRSADSSCTSPFTHPDAIALITGAVAVPVMAWLLMLGSGLVLRRRLKNRRDLGYDSPALQVAADRFSSLCDVNGLHGRHRPKLVLAAPSRLTAQAYTTAVPFTRPQIIIPVAYAYLDVGQLDLVILHELAHVRSRDLTWAAATWWTGWLNLAAFAIAFIPLVHRYTLIPRDYYQSLWLTVILSAIVLTLRTAVLRRREQLADHYAVTVLNNPGLLVTAIAATRAPTHSQSATPAKDIPRRWLRVTPSSGSEPKKRSQERATGKADSSSPQPAAYSPCSPSRLSAPFWWICRASPGPTRDSRLTSR